MAGLYNRHGEFTARYVLNIFTSRNLESVYCAVRTEYIHLEEQRVFTARYGLNIFTSMSLESVYCAVRTEYIHLGGLGECLLRGTD